jgi:hypothetical protein
VRSHWSAPMKLLERAFIAGTLGFCGVILLMSLGVV